MAKRHDGSDAVPLSARPLAGHIGFQNLSRGGDDVQIRNAKIRELKQKRRPGINEGFLDPKLEVPGADQPLRGRSARDFPRPEPDPQGNRALGG